MDLFFYCKYLRISTHGVQLHASEKKQNNISKEQNFGAIDNPPPPCVFCDLFLWYDRSRRAKRCCTVVLLYCCCGVTSGGVSRLFLPLLPTGYPSRVGRSASVSDLR